MRALLGIGLEQITGYGQPVTTKKMAFGILARQQDGLTAFEPQVYIGARVIQVAIILSVIIGNGFPGLEHGRWVEHMPQIATQDIFFRACTTDLGDIT